MCVCVVLKWNKQNIVQGKNELKMKQKERAEQKKKVAATDNGDNNQWNNNNNLFLIHSECLCVVDCLSVRRTIVSTLQTAEKKKRVFSVEKSRRKKNSVKENRRHFVNLKS